MDSRRPRCYSASAGGFSNALQAPKKQYLLSEVSSIFNTKTMQPEPAVARTAEGCRSPRSRGAGPGGTGRLWTNGLWKSFLQREKRFWGWNIHLSAEP